jgi:two-component system NtrC family sensor kinase
VGGETVLVVEDHRENIVHLVNNVLKPGGYNVITAMDGRLGLKRILSDNPDLVILDLNMPGMDGLEVLDSLQKRQVDTPVILTTFYGSEQVAEQALRLGAAAYVVKPYQLDEMRRAIDKALAGRPAPRKPAHPENEHALEETMPLTRHVERWARDMNILTRVGKALVAQLNVKRICSRAVEAAIYLTRASQAFVLLLDEEDETKLCLCATRGPDDRRVRLIREPIESELALKAAHAGQMLVLENAPDELGLAKAIGHELGPLAAAPLRWQQETFGVLLAGRDPGMGGFSEANLEWLSGLADYTAIAVRNAQVHQQGHQPPALDDQGIAALRTELSQLGSELQAAGERLQTMADLLAPDG